MFEDTTLMTKNGLQRKKEFVSGQLFHAQLNRHSCSMSQLIFNDYRLIRLYLNVRIACGSTLIGQKTKRGELYNLCIAWSQEDSKPTKMFVKPKWFKCCSLKHRLTSGPEGLCGVYLLLICIWGWMNMSICQRCYCCYGPWHWVAIFLDY